MFDRQIYIKRREELKKNFKSGLLLFLGNDEAPINYPANTYNFRQDSSFLYYFGLPIPNLAGIIDVDENKEYLFGYEYTLEDIVWMGPQPKLTELAERVGVQNSDSISNLKKIPENKNQQRGKDSLPAVVSWRT